MISRLAESTYQKWLSEGLKPSFQDMIDLNTVGTILERNSNSSAFYSAPRMSFLGDLILEEPSIEKQIYIDKIRGIFSKDDYSCLYAIVYVLNTDFESLPKLDNIRNLTRAITRFTKEYLMKYTERQIMAAVSYALHGFDEESLSRNYDDVSDEMKQSIELPKESASMAQMLLNKAIGYGLDESCKTSTIPQLERILAIASMREGADIIKDENIERTGNFYKVSGKIHERLLKEKANKPV